MRSFDFQNFPTSCLWLSTPNMNSFLKKATHFVKTAFFNQTLLSFGLTSIKIGDQIQRFNADVAHFILCKPLILHMTGLVFLLAVRSFSAGWRRHCLWRRLSDTTVMLLSSGDGCCCLDVPPLNFIFISF